MSISTSSIKFLSFDLFWNFDIICIISIKTCNAFHYCSIKFVFCQSNMMKILRVLLLNKVLTILLIVILKLKIFFEINKITIDCIIVDEITNKLTINEKLKTWDKRTWNRFNVLVLFNDELLSKNDDTINRETKFWYVYNCWYFCVIAKNRSQILRKTSLFIAQLIEKTNTLTNDDLIFRATKAKKLSINSKKQKWIIIKVATICNIFINKNRVY